MEPYAIPAALAAVCVIWFTVVSIMVYESLRKRGLPVSFLWLRLMIPKYAHQYKEVTKAETEQVGPLFYHWVISINLALVFVIVAVVAGI